MDSPSCPGSHHCSHLNNHQARPGYRSRARQVGRWAGVGVAGHEEAHLVTGVPPPGGAQGSSEEAPDEANPTPVSERSEVGKESTIPQLPLLSEVRPSPHPPPWGAEWPSSVHMAPGQLPDSVCPALPVPTAADFSELRVCAVWTTSTSEGSEHSTQRCL